MRSTSILLEIESWQKNGRLGAVTFSALRKRASPRWRLLGSPALLLLIPPVAAIVYVAVFATATPLTDEWMMLWSAMELHKHGWSLDSLRLMEFQNAQHLIIVPYLIYLPLEELTNYDSRALVGVTLVCFAIQFAVFRLRLVKDNLAAFPIGLLMFSPSHYMELHWGFQFTIALSVTFAVVGLAILDNIENDIGQMNVRNYVIGTMLLLFGAFSSAPGYFGFFSAALLVALKPIAVRTKIILSLTWLLVVPVIYFGILDPGAAYAEYIFGLRDVLYVLTALGSVIWGSPTGLTEFGVDKSSLTGLALIIAFIIVLARTRKGWSWLALPIALVTLGLGPITASAVSRTYLGNWHLQMVLPAVCGIYSAGYMTWRRIRSPFDAALFASIVFILLLNMVSYGVGFSKYGPDYRSYVDGIENYILSYSPSLKKPFPPGGHDIDPEMIEFLREKHHPLFARQFGIQVSPINLSECDPPTTITVGWNFKNKQNISLPISVYVAAPGATESLFFTSPYLEGTQDTGPWAGAKMTFVAKEQENGNELARITVGGIPCQ